MCPNLEYWKFYIHYVKVTKENGTNSNSRQDITAAYEYAIQHMYLDINATSLFTDYINYLKEYKVTTQYEEGLKINGIRKVYHKAIETPMNNLEVIWKDYDLFENELNKILAKALLNDKAPKYMLARSIYRERKRYYEGILRNMLPVPLSETTTTEKENNQISLWKRLLDYEKSNPQKLEGNGAYSRMVFTYKQCLMCLYYCPEIWFEYANYEMEQGHIDLAINVFEKSLIALPNSLLLHFAYADLLENNKNIKGAKEVYEKLLLANQNILVYIQYMKFSRRTEGMKESRIIFKRGRSCVNITYHLFVCAALIEWHLNKDQNVARNIFDLGMAKFSNDPNYVLHYIQFLSHLNEENNLRVLFEKAVSTIPKEKCREIWNLYLQFEYNYGDLTSISKIEARKSKVYGTLETGILNVVNRFRYFDLWPCSIADLESFEREPAPKHDDSNTKEENNINVIAKSTIDLTRYPRPDLSQHSPFVQDVSTLVPGVPAGVPDIIAQLIVTLPPANTWLGPVLDLDTVINLYTENVLPPPPPGAELTMLPDSSVVATNQSSKKRKVEEEEEEEEQTQNVQLNGPPPQDLFRKRQAAKLKQKNL